MARKAPRLHVAALSGAAALLIGSLAPARAVGASLHDIPWYMGHDAARAATIKLCRSDHRFARDADCLNAATAEDRLYAQRSASGAFGDDELVNPQYWAGRRLVRRGVIASCQHPPTIYRPATCAAALQGDALDPAGPTRR